MTDEQWQGGGEEKMSQKKYGNVEMIEVIVKKVAHSRSDISTSVKK